MFITLIRISTCYSDTSCSFSYRSQNSLNYLFIFFFQSFQCVFIFIFFFFSELTKTGHNFNLPKIMCIFSINYTKTGHDFNLSKMIVHNFFPPIFQWTNKNREWWRRCRDPSTTKVVAGSATSRQARLCTSSSSRLTEACSAMRMRTPYSTNSSTLW